MSNRISPILGPDGQPIRRELLSTEIAIPTDLGVRSVIREGVASGLSPETLAALLREAATGNARRYLTLAEEMEERYLHYASQLQTRRLAIDAIEPAVDAPESVPSAIVDAVHELVASTAFREMIPTLSDGIGKGYAVSELMWDYREARLRPVEFIWRDPRFFVFDRVSLTKLRLAVDGNPDGEDLPPAKFVRHVPRSKMGVPLRGGIARPAAWAFMLQSFSLKDWAAFSEVYGMPIRVGKYPASATDNDIRTLLRALRSIGSDAAAAIPIGMEFEFAKVEGQHGAAVYGGLIEYVDKQVSKLVVGQTMTADEGGSLAQAKVHNEVRLDILRADGRQLGNTITRDVIEPFVLLNFGPQAVYPRVRFPVAEPEDVKELAEAVSKLVPIGLKVGQRQMRDKLGLSEPEADEDLLAPPAAPAPPARPAFDPAQLAALRGELDGFSHRFDAAGRHGGGCRCRSCADPARLSSDAAALPDEDAIDRLLAAELAEWEEITDPLLEQIFALAAEETTLDGVLRRLDGLRLDSGLLRERLARSTAIARGFGVTGAD